LTARQVPVLESKLKVSQNENDRLSNSVLELKDHLEKKRDDHNREMEKSSAIPDLENQIKLYTNEADILQKLNNELKNANNDLRGKVSSQEVELHQLPVLNQEIEVLRNRIVDYENQIRRLHGENSELVHLRGVDRRNEEESKNHYNSLVLKFEAEIADKDNQLYGMDIDNNRLKNTNQDLELRLNEATAKVHTIPEMDTKLKIFANENERLQGIINELNENLRNSENQKIDYKQKALKVPDLENNVRLLVDKNDKLTQVIDELRNS